MPVAINPFSELFYSYKSKALFSKQTDCKSRINFGIESSHVLWKLSILDHSTLLDTKYFKWNLHQNRDLKAW